MELNDDPEQKIARPRQIYTGEREREYVAIGDREGARADHRPARPPGRSGRATRLSWRLTVRHGSEVKRRRNLDEAIAELQRTADAIHAEGLWTR